MSFAVIPIKHLSQGKTRLASRRGREELEPLCLAMLRDIVSALQQTPSLDRVAVVTPDESVAQAARDAGAVGLLRDDPGLNASIDAAIAEVGNPREASLVILGDVAGALPDDLESLFRTLEADQPTGQVVLAASRDGGTAALLRAPANAIPSCFGPQSAHAHRKAADAIGVAFHEVSLPSLEIDLDRPEDVDDFLARPGGGKQTRRILEAIGWEKTK